MTNDIISKDIIYLAELSAAAGDFDTAKSSTSREVPDSVSIRSNRFWLRTAEGEKEAPNQLKLQFVYIGGKKPKGRAYYQEAWNPDNPLPPTCMSYDGVTPEEGCDIPVVAATGQPARSCRECPMSKWDSAVSRITGKGIPACREQKDIVIKVLDVPGLYLLRIPPYSIKKWDAAIGQIQAAIGLAEARGEKSNLNLGSCVFQAEFETNAVGVLSFRPLGYAQANLAAEIVAARKDQETIDRMLWGPTGAVRRERHEGVSKAPPPVIEKPQPIAHPFSPGVRHHKAERPEPATAGGADNPDGGFKRKPDVKSILSSMENEK